MRTKTFLLTLLLAFSLQATAQDEDPNALKTAVRDAAINGCVEAQLVALLRDYQTRALASGKKTMSEEAARAKLSSSDAWKNSLELQIRGVCECALEQSLAPLIAGKTVAEVEAATLQFEADTKDPGKKIAVIERAKICTLSLNKPR